MQNNLLIKKILVVDDQTENRNIVKEALKSFDVEIFEAENGKEAVDLFTKHLQEPFDVITMDYLMPELNGAEAVIQIKSIDKNVPIICISASIKVFRPQVKHFDNMFFLDKPLNVVQFKQIFIDIQKN